jgi:Kinesin motor domain
VAKALQQVHCSLQCLHAVHSAQTRWHVQDSLGGDAKALMFCNLAPQPLHVSETLSSLAFASKVSSVVLKTPTRRVEEARDMDGEGSPTAGDRMATPPPRPGLPTPRSRTPSGMNNGSMRM